MNVNRVLRLYQKEIEAGCQVELYRIGKGTNHFHTDNIFEYIKSEKADTLTEMLDVFSDFLKCKAEYEYIDAEEYERTVLANSSLSNEDIGIERTDTFLCIGIR